MRERWEVVLADEVVGAGDGEPDVPVLVARFGPKAEIHHHQIDGEIDVITVERRD